MWALFGGGTLEGRLARQKHSDWRKRLAIFIDAIRLEQKIYDNLHNCRTDGTMVYVT